MANVSGFSVAEYAEVCEKLGAEEQVGWLEVNISCPNVHGGGAAFGAEPSAAAEVTRAVRAVTKKPVIMKLSPAAADIAAVAPRLRGRGGGRRESHQHPARACASISSAARRCSPTHGAACPAPGCSPLAVRMVYQVYEAVSIPIVGMGGVNCAEDVLELMLAGATAVGIGAANLVEPFACRQIVADLPRVMQTYGINDLNDIIGGAHHG